MTATTNTRVDPLEELAVASRYAAVSNRLASLASLTEREEAAVRQGTPDRRIHQAGSEIVLEGETTTPMFIASGWACRTRTSRDGRRQIVGLLLPGDGISLGAAHGAVLNTSVTALTAVETVSAAGIVEMANDAATFPGVNEALHSLRVLEDEFLVNQITRLGVATVVERVTHLLLELHWRLGHAGLATETLVPLPVNEETLGDALGLRPQAIKRVLYQLRAHGLIRLGYGRIAIKREDRLRTISGFRPPATSPRAAERRLICDVNAPVPEQAFQANTRTNAEVAMRPEDSSRVVAFQARQLACQLTPP